MATPSLTTDAIQRILNGEQVERPVLQILAYKKVPSDGKSQVRFRFIMSDGQKSHQCCIMIGDNLIQRVEKGEFERYTILRLDEYEWNDIKENKVRISLLCLLPLTDCL